MNDSEWGARSIHWSGDDSQPSSDFSTGGAGQHRGDLVGFGFHRKGHLNPRGGGGARRQRGAGLGSPGVGLLRLGLGFFFSPPTEFRADGVGTSQAGG